MFIWQRYTLAARHVSLRFIYYSISCNPIQTNFQMKRKGRTARNQKFRDGEIQLDHPILSCPLYQSEQCIATIQGRAGTIHFYNWNTRRIYQICFRGTKAAGAQRRFPQTDSTCLSALRYVERCNVCLTTPPSSALQLCQKPTANAKETDEDTSCSITARM